MGWTAFPCGSVRDRRSQGAELIEIRGGTVGLRPRHRVPRTIRVNPQTWEGFYVRRVVKSPARRRGRAGLFGPRRRKLCERLASLRLHPADVVRYQGNP